METSILYIELPGMVASGTTGENTLAVLHHYRLIDIDILDENYTEFKIEKRDRKYYNAQKKCLEDSCTFKPGENIKLHIAKSDNAPIHILGKGASGDWSVYLTIDPEKEDGVSYENPLAPPAPIVLRLYPQLSSPAEPPKSVSGKPQISPEANMLLQEHRRELTAQYGEGSDDFLNKWRQGNLGCGLYPVRDLTVTVQIPRSSSVYKTIPDYDGYTASIYDPSTGIAKNSTTLYSRDDWTKTLVSMFGEIVKSAKRIFVYVVKANGGLFLKFLVAKFPPYMTTVIPALDRWMAKMPVPTKAVTMNVGQTIAHDLRALKSAPNMVVNTIIVLIDIHIWNRTENADAVDLMAKILNTALGIIISTILATLAVIIVTAIAAAVFGAVAIGAFVVGVITVIIGGAVSLGMNYIESETILAKLLRNIIEIHKNRVILDHAIF